MTTVFLLMAPSAFLFIVPSHKILKLILIIVFVMIFSAALSIFTKAYAGVFLVKLWAFVNQPTLTVSTGDDTSFSLAPRLIVQSLWYANEYV